MDTRGTSALLDAFLFLAIALIASAAALGAAYSESPGEDAARRSASQAYAEDVRAAFLRTTVANLSYADGAGARVVLGPVSLERFLVDEGALLLGGVDLAGFADANARVGSVLEDLVVPAYDGAVELGFPGDPGDSVWIPEDGVPLDRFTSGWTYETPAGPVEVSVHVWFR